MTLTLFTGSSTVTLFLSCSEPKQILATNTAAYTVVADGSSYEKAIAINEKTEYKGVRAEYKWLSENYPGYIFISQNMIIYLEKPYDIITIKTGKGVKNEVYFEISSFSGKF